MLTIILKILSILGILLLILLAVVLLVLFFPIAYCIDGVKNPQTTYLNIKVRWLFGLFRGGVVYPQPGRWLVKGLCFTLFDSQAAPKKIKSGKRKKKRSNKDEDTVEQTEENNNNSTGGHNKQGDNEREASRDESRKAEADKKSGKENVQEQGSENIKSTSRKEKLFTKYEKIKYTIKKFYDKIKYIFNEISFYKKLVQDEQTKKLFSHACKRVRKVLQHIKPRKIKTNVVFGTGSPDTTGYVFAVYGMLSPKLGKDVCITPDFTEQIFEGTFYAKGHITVFTLLVNGCALVFDKRLRLLKRRINNHVKITERHGN